MKYTIENAMNFINKEVKNVNQKYRLKYHMMPPIGWMNDPNGCVKFSDDYHIFYQFYPYDTKWGPMHWGHFVSKDLIKYQDEIVALAPDCEMESGCWSGGAIANEDKLTLVYTRHYEKDNFKKQEQYIATSNDGVTYKKNDFPSFDNDKLLSDIVKCDFRDPFPIYLNGNYYLLVGAKLKSNEGIIVVLKGSDLNNFDYHFSIGPFYEMGNMCECPSYFNVDGVDVIIASGCEVKEKGNSYKNVNSSFYMAGYVDFENKKYNFVEIRELDKGDCFYAPQFINSIDKPIMISWMEMWGKEYPTVTLNHKWNGALAIPRVLSWKNNTIYQEPIEEIKNYYVNSFKYNGNDISSISDIEINASNNFKIIFEATNGLFVIGQDKNGVYLDTNGANTLNDCVRHTDNYYKNCKIRVLLDRSSVEMFINDGVEVITSRVFLDSNYKLSITGEVSIYVNEIEVDR